MVGFVPAGYSPRALPTLVELFRKESHVSGQSLGPLLHSDDMTVTCGVRPQLAKVMATTGPSHH